MVGTARDAPLLTLHAEFPTPVLMALACREDSAANSETNSIVSTIP